MARSNVLTNEASNHNERPQRACEEALPLLDLLAILDDRRRLLLGRVHDIRSPRHERLLLR